MTPRRPDDQPSVPDDAMARHRRSEFRPKTKPGEPVRFWFRFCHACNVGEHAACNDRRYGGPFATGIGAPCECKYEGHPAAPVCLEEVFPPAMRGSGMLYVCGRPLAATVQVERGRYLEVPHDKAVCALQADHHATGS